MACYICGRDRQTRPSSVKLSTGRGYMDMKTVEKEMCSECIRLESRGEL